MHHEHMPRGVHGIAKFAAFKTARNGIRSACQSHLMDRLPISAFSVADIWSQFRHN
jgi:hypothetical protein